MYQYRVPEMGTTEVFLALSPSSLLKVVSELIYVSKDQILLVGTSLAFNE